MLAEGAVGLHGRGQGGAQAKNSRALKSPLEMAVADHELLGQVSDFYHRRLAESPKALKYLEKRGITGEAIKQFQIGFCDRSLARRLPITKTQAGKEIRDRLKDVGVLKKETGNETLRGCVTFPVQLHGGGVGEIYGRRIDNYPAAKTPLHWYLSDQHVGVWNLAALQASNEIILCESIIDALTFWCAGYRNVTNCYGPNGFTDAIHKALVAHNVKRILIAFDNDEEGNTAADEIARQLLHDNFEVFRVKFPAGMDASEYAKTAQSGGGGNVHNWLGLVIRNADWLGKGQAPELTTNAPDFLAEARKEIATERAAEELATKATEQSGEAKAKSGKKGKKQESTGSKATSSTSESGPVVSALTAETSEKPEAAQPPSASPTPTAPKEVEAEVGDREISLTIGNRTYRVRGLAKNLAFDVLKVNVLVRRDESFYVDSFDLYAARARGVFVKEAARELGFDSEVIKRDLGKVLLKLEELQDQQIEEALAVNNDEIELSDKDKQAALDLLKEPNLVERILADFAACGVVGEETNKLVGYLAATSRKLDKPLAVVIQSSSAAGKSSLMDAILRFIPNEEQVNYSAMTGQSLFYMGGMELSHKILAIAEEEGVAQASYALKLLQSEGELTIASTGKDPGTGRMETQEYHVEGPVMIFLTTTAIDIDEELLNRCVVLSVDENRLQTRSIHAQQRTNETLEGALFTKRTAAVRKLHQNAQRLLRPLVVVNPYAPYLRFTDDCARRRRDHLKYLTLIRAIALLHQYQRTIKTTTIDDEVIQYIEVVPADIALANRLANQILGNSIDELPPQTRRLLVELYDWVQSECKRLEIEQSEFEFTRRRVRESLGWGQTQLQLHFKRLQDMEYLLIRRGSHGSTIFYKLLWDGRGREGQPTLCGLIDVIRRDRRLITRVYPKCHP